MTIGSAPASLMARLREGLRRAGTSPEGACLIMIGAVLCAAALRTSLSGFGNFYYLPMGLAILVTALLTGPVYAYGAIGLSIVINLLTVERASVTDATANAILFAIVSGSIIEARRRLVAASQRERALSQELAEREAMLHALLASVPALTLDQYGRVYRTTPSADLLLGLAPGEAKGLPITSLIRNLTLPSPETIEGGALVAPPAGHWSSRVGLPLALHAERLPAKAAPELVALTLSDQSHDEAVRSRARELNAQLNQVWHLNSMGELAATLAHELNQPLTAAAVYLHSGQSQLDRAGLLDHEAAQALDLAKTQMLRAGEIIRRTRELVSTGTHSQEPVRVSELIGDLEPVLQLVSRDANVAIQISVSPDNDLVHADRIQVQQAITNLVRNAVDAAGTRLQGEVVISGRSLSDAGYELRVEDNGPGIPDDRISVLSQPVRSDKSGGMGMGLCVTRSIVENHGGQLTIGRSTMGGAAFSFRLSRLSELAAA